MSRYMNELQHNIKIAKFHAQHNNADAAASVKHCYIIARMIAADDDARGLERSSLLEYDETGRAQPAALIIELNNLAATLKI